MPLIGPGRRPGRRDAAVAAPLRRVVDATALARKAAANLAFRWIVYPRSISAPRSGAAFDETARFKYLIGLAYLGIHVYDRRPFSERNGRVG